MKVKELRIGNLVAHIGSVCVLEEIGEEWVKVTNDQLNTKIDDLIPIPLTEDWLVKFGFEVYDFDHKENQYRFKERLFVIRDGLFCDYGSGVVLKYVHQLQNLYFALTGEELELI
jgi:hypothetical protein